MPMSVVNKKQESNSQFSVIPLNVPTNLNGMSSKVKLKISERLKIYSI